jgi:protein TonB
MRRRNIGADSLPEGSRFGDTAIDILDRNVRYRPTSQAGAPPGAAVRVHPPQGRLGFPGKAAPRRPVALAISALVHVVAMCVLLVWPQPKLPPLPTLEQTVDLALESPAEVAQPLPEPPPAETPNQPDEPAAVAPSLPEEPVQPVEEPPSEPAPMPPPPPSVRPEELPKPPPSDPPPPELLSTAPKEPPKPQAPPPGPRPRPVVRPVERPGERPVVKPTPPVTAPASPNTPAAPPSKPSPAPAEAPPAPVGDGWRQALSAWLAAHKTYPEAARRTGAEGAVTLRFTVNRSGHVLDVVLVRSADSPVLDAAAEAMLRGATLPSFPPGMPQDSITATVQVRYTLTN